MNQGVYELDQSHDVNVVASLFKIFFRDLQSPLIPFTSHFDCIRSANDIVSLNDIIANLPLLNRRVLAFLITFLQLFAKPEASKMSKMTSANLAMVRCSSLRDFSGS
jgi:hypothetical protein